MMTDTEVELQVQVQVQVQPDASPPLPGQDAFTDPPQEDSEVDDEPLLLLAEVALASPGGRLVSCCSPEVQRMERVHQSAHLQLQFLLSKAENLQACISSGQDHVEREAVVGAVSDLLYTSQPFFNYLETTARSSFLQNSHVCFDLRSKLLDFSQQLCQKLELLVLTYASYGFLSLDETEPSSISHFCIGQTQLGQLKLSIFRYCVPTPYLAQVRTGLYKRMRWNVEKLRDEEWGGAEDKTHTDYYFLCYEDIPDAQAEADGGRDGVSHRMWSIGQWVQVTPDPKTEDMNDWILCEVPQGSYLRLLVLGPMEPSSCSATDHLQQLLLSCPRVM